jgi:K+-sensing histidine kinase KdpD
MNKMSTIAAEAPKTMADAAEQLIEVVQQFSKVKSLHELIDITKRAARRITDADGATFVLRDEDKCYYVDEDAIGPLWKGRRFPMEACVSGWAMRQRQPAIIPDIFTDDRIPIDAYRVTFVKSLAMTPIRLIDPIGAIGIYWSEAHRPTPEAVRWLQTLADSTALAIEHLQALDERRAAISKAATLRSENAELRAEIGRDQKRELLRMCFVTKRFELDGKWVPIEVLLESRFGVHVSHGLCPEALEGMARSHFGSESVVAALRQERLLDESGKEPVSADLN